jgi:hypothetical protein
MPISVNNTTITFNDATTQTTGFTSPLPVANGGTGGTTQATARAGIGAGTGNGNGNGNGNGSGTVTSVATGNGLSGGTITSSGTLVVACPGFNTVGSYCFCAGDYLAYSSGGNYAAGDIQSVYIEYDGGGATTGVVFKQNNLSGTWKLLGAGSVTRPISLFCRVS